jgi:CRP/FNR family transcriptional regulator
VRESEMLSRIEKAFPLLQELPQRSLEQLRAQAVPKSLEPGQVLVREGTECGHLPLVLKGALRVYKISDAGRELTLYRIERGESCILTATCILNGGRFPAVAEAEGPTELVLLPARLLLSMVDEQPEWRRFVFGLYSKRLEMLITLVEEVAFQHIDFRLAAWLLKAAAGSPGVVTGTHSRIASELGTSREVVSRILKDFEAEGLLTTLRGKIHVLRPDQLRKKASDAAAV